MSQFWHELDLHVFSILLLCAPIGLLSGWWLLVPLLLPQGRIGVRAFVDYPSFSRCPYCYLIANELLVVVVVAILFLIQS